MNKKTTEDWLYEIGYDIREDNQYGDEKVMVNFMRGVRREQQKEARRYIDEIENCEDDYYIKMKNGDIKRK